MKLPLSKLSHYPDSPVRADADCDPNDTLHYCSNSLNQYNDTGADAGCDPPTEQFTYDADGNLTASTGSVGVPPAPDVPARVYRWDAENRLIDVRPPNPSTGDKRVAFDYDYMGRRVRMRVFEYSFPGGNELQTPIVDRVWVYHGWLPLVEYDRDSSTGALTVRTKQTWGLDLAGLNGSVNSIDSAGGIGGMVAWHWALDTDPGTSGVQTKSFVPFYDANVNVVQLLEHGTAGNTLGASYEYDPFGNVTASSGAFAADNPFRFSTKYWVDEIGKGDWGVRWYDGSRWMSRDPIEESGGAHLYAYTSNRVIDSVDPNGAVPLYPQLFDCRVRGCEKGAVLVLPGTGFGERLGREVARDRGWVILFANSDDDVRAAVECGCFREIMIISHGTDIGYKSTLRGRLKGWLPWIRPDDSTPGLLSGDDERPVNITPEVVRGWKRACCLREVELYACFQGYGTRRQKWQDAFGEDVHLRAHSGNCYPHLRWLLQW